MSERQATLTAGLWFLDGYTRPGEELVRTPLRPLPFRIGRRSGLSLTLGSPSVSQEHAEIFAEGGQLWVRDLGSTNGTFLNRRRLLGPAVLANGDILHFAEEELRLSRELTLFGPLTDGTLQLKAVELSARLGDGGRAVRKLIAEKAVTPLYQPIVALADESLAGYETLCRGASEELPSDPKGLFETAEADGLEREVSALFRSVAALAARRRLDGVRLFLNTHPNEINEPGMLLGSLADLARALEPAGPRLVLEIHESSVTDLGAMRELASGLALLGIDLAYDDFGAGQARLLELVEAPPAFLKFDISLVRQLDQASAGRRRLVRTLVAMAHDLGLATIAEGIESREEAGAAQEVGFDLAQGFLFGRPGALP